MPGGGEGWDLVVLSLSEEGVGLASFLEGDVLSLWQTLNRISLSLLHSINSFSGSFLHISFLKSGRAFFFSNMFAVAVGKCLKVMGGKVSGKASGQSCPPVESAPSPSLAVLKCRGYSLGRGLGQAACVAPSHSDSRA